MASLCVRREKGSPQPDLIPLRLWREYRNTGFKTKWHDWGNMTHLPLKLYSWERQRGRSREEQAGQAWKQMSEETRDSKGERDREKERTENSELRWMDGFCDSWRMIEKGKRRKKWGRSRERASSLPPAAQASLSLSRSHSKAVSYSLMYL